MSLPQFELAHPPGDAISALQFAPSGSRLLVASWDKRVYLYDSTSASEGSNGRETAGGAGAGAENGSEGGGGRLLKTFEHRAPVLDVCWGEEGKEEGEEEEEVYSTGLDWDVRRINLSTGVQTVLSSHTAGVKSLAYSYTHKILVSASWDSTLHIHHPHNPSLSHSTITLPSKPFSLSLTPTKLVIVMASRALHIYDLDTLASESSPPSSSPGPRVLQIEPWQRRESALRFMARAVACMPNDAGYACSSIEGRVAVEWFDPSASSQARKYAFKCHRQPSPEGVDVIYPVNALAFHPIHGTFASGGGDGFVALWDGIGKRRIRQYQRYAASVAALSFSSDGKSLAVGISPGFEDGKEDTTDGIVKIFIRELGENEAKGKGAK